MLWLSWRHTPKRRTYRRVTPPAQVWQTHNEPAERGREPVGQCAGRAGRCRREDRHWPKFLKPSTLRFSRQGTLQWFPGSPCSSGGSGAGPLMPGVASGTAGAVGAMDSVTVASVDTSELASVPRLLGS